MSPLRWLLERLSNTSVIPLHAVPPGSGGAAPAHVLAEIERLIKERQHVIDQAREESLLDGAFSILLFEQRWNVAARWRHMEPVALSEVFPSITGAQLADVQARAVKLIKGAYSAGDELISSKFEGIIQIKERLASEHPGFSDESYFKTIDYGCYLAK